jgi:hypothetical protein
MAEKPPPTAPDSIGIGPAELSVPSNPAAEILFVSASTGEGVDAWCDWLRARL